MSRTGSGEGRISDRRPRGRHSRALVAMCGAAGSGKSTYATHHWPGRVLSLDEVREWISGDPGDQSVTDRAVPLWHAELAARLQRDGLIVADATNLVPEHRAALLQIADAAGAAAIAVVVDVDLATALARNATRPPNLRVPAETVEWMHARAQEAAAELALEGWQVHVVTGTRRIRTRGSHRCVPPGAGTPDHNHQNTEEEERRENGSR